jgi:hypothetical protein
MKAAQFWNVQNVKSFRGCDVVNGEIDLSDSEYAEIVDELYGPVTVMGMSYNQSTIIMELDHIAWSCAKRDHENYLQSELEDQLDNEDENDIEFFNDIEDEE